MKNASDGWIYQYGHRLHIMVEALTGE